METIRNAAGVAATYVGLGGTEQSGTEPVSGQTGSGTAGEPYDAGNKVDDEELGGAAPQETSSTPKESATSQSGTEPISGETGSGTASDPYDAGNSDGSAIGGQAPQENSTTDSALPKSDEPSKSIEDEASTSTDNPTSVSEDPASSTADPISDNSAPTNTKSSSSSDDKPTPITAEDFPTVRDPPKDTYVADAKPVTSADEASGAAGNDKPLPDVPANETSSEANEDDEVGGKKSIGSKLKDKLHIGKH